VLPVTTSPLSLTTSRTFLCGSPLSYGVPRLWGRPSAGICSDSIWNGIDPCASSKGWCVQWESNPLGRQPLPSLELAGPCLAVPTRDTPPGLGYHRGCGQSTDRHDLCAPRARHSHYQDEASTFDPTIHLRGMNSVEATLLLQSSNL
jgi:hypothetical protein